MEINKIEEKSGTNFPTKDLGVGVIGARNSRKGKFCHQCRPKKKDFAPSCKGSKDKPCVLSFCHKCLLNRYGENSEEVGNLEGWICPKRRGVFYCSYCLMKRGFQLTGILTHTAKTTGFNSVLQPLHGNGEELLVPQNVGKESTTSPKKFPLSYNKEPPSSKRTHDQENEHVEQKHGKSIEEGLPNKEKKSKRLKICSDCKEDFVLPLGRPLTDVAFLELPTQDVGAALQFLEFCNAFSEVIDIKKGQPECILQDLFIGCAVHHGVPSRLVDFHINLLSLIEEDMEKVGDAWLKILRGCIEKSECFLNELPMDFLDIGLSGYDNLGPSRKLNILIFLCDEVLGTNKLRNWIDEAAAKFDGERKGNRENVLAPKREEKFIRWRMKDEKAKAMVSASEGNPLSLVEFDAHLSQLKTEVDTVHAEVLASLELVHKIEHPRSGAVRTELAMLGSNGQRLWKLSGYNSSCSIILQEHPMSDAVRTELAMLGSNGQRFWKLSGYNSSCSIILQEIGSLDTAALQDKWSFYNEEEEKGIEKHISSFRNRKRIRRPSDDVEDGVKSESLDSRESEHGLLQDESEVTQEGVWMDSMELETVDWIHGDGIHHPPWNVVSM